MKKRRIDRVIEELKPEEIKKAREKQILSELMRLVNMCEQKIFPKLYKEDFIQEAVCTYLAKREKYIFNYSREVIMRYCVYESMEKVLRQYGRRVRIREKDMDTEVREILFTELEEQGEEEDREEERIEKIAYERGEDKSLDPEELAYINYLLSLAIVYLGEEIIEKRLNGTPLEDRERKRVERFRKLMKEKGLIE